MPKITFTGVRVTKGNFTNDEGKVSRHIHVRANIGKAVRDAMDWQEIPDCAEEMKLTGQLHGETLILTPKDDKLARHEIECSCDEVAEFKACRIQDKDGESRKLELRFRISISARAALAKFESYCEQVGDAPADLRIGYSEQAELPMDDKPPKVIIDGVAQKAGA